MVDNFLKKIAFSNLSNFYSFLFNLKKAKLQVNQQKNVLCIKKNYIKISIFDNIIAVFYKMAKIGKILEIRKSNKTENLIY